MADFDGDIQNLIQRKEDRNLNKHRQAACGGINLFPAVHFQSFLLEFHFIVAVSFLQFFNLRLDFFHLGHAVV